MSDVVLNVGNQTIKNWQSVHVSLNAQALSGYFQLSLASHSKETFPFSMGETCKLIIDNKSIITGFIEKITQEISHSDVRLSVSGRDKTCDLIDCSLTQPKFYKNFKIIDIIKDIVKPFRIDVMTQDESKVIPFFSVESGKVFDIISNLAKKNDRMLSTDGRGSLLLSKNKPKQNHKSLVLGHNILSLSHEKNFENVFSDYFMFLGNKKISVKDKSINRHRPLEITDDTESYEQKIKWEQKERQRKSVSLRIKTHSWDYFPGDSVKVVADRFGIHDFFFVNKVSFVKNKESGTLSHLELYRF